MTYKQIVDRYIQKWDKILFSTQLVDRNKATKAVIDAYKAINLPPPEIFFLSSPSLEQNLNFVSLSGDKERYPIRLKSLLNDRLSVTLNEQLIDETNLDPRLTLKNRWSSRDNRGQIFEGLCDILYEHVYNVHCDRYNINFHKTLEYELIFTNSWFYDFYINQISHNPDLEIWMILRDLCEECPYLITYEDACLIIDRPSELYLDRELVPHAEGKAAIKFADGYELYCNHGTVIPTKYGQVNPSEWRSESIISDEDNNVIRADSESIVSILFNIGYKKFGKELPNTKDRYWNNGQGLLRSYTSFIDYSLRYIPDWLNFYYYDYYDFGESYYTSSVSEEIVDWDTHRKYLEGWYDREQSIYKSLPFKVSEEMKLFYRAYSGDYQLAPRLDFPPLSKAIENFKPKLNTYLLPIAYGNRQELYYVICDNGHKQFSPVYCQVQNEEPIVYAECLINWIAAIEQCYRDGGYYVAIDEETGEKLIEQNLDKIEPIFEKFNPDQIDNWRKIWKS